MSSGCPLGPSDIMFEIVVPSVCLKSTYTRPGLVSPLFSEDTQEAAPMHWKTEFSPLSGSAERKPPSLYPAAPCRV
jgi:hypothetical protein